MEKKFQVFDSFQEAEAFDRSTEKNSTPAERISRCYQLSIEGWRLHKGPLPNPRLRKNPIIRVGSLGEPDPSD